MREDKDDIRRYRDGSMTGAERRALEKRALNDPFLADALEGSESISQGDFETDIESISRKLRPTAPSWAPLRIAAGVIVILGGSSLVYLLNSTEPEQLALEQSRAPLPSDSAASSAKPDSSSSMIAMTKDSPEKEPKQAEAAASKPAPSVAGPKPDAIAGPADQKPLTETQPSTLARVEAEKADEVSRVADLNVADKVQTEEPPGAGAKKEAGVHRAAETRKAIVERIVEGVVTSEEDGTPLSGVHVLIKGTVAGTITDLQGKYKIVLPSDQVTLSYSLTGLETKEIVPVESIVNVKLKPGEAQSSDVVVSASRINPADRDDSKPLRVAEPIGGIRAYNKYLEDNLKFPTEALARKVKGEVTIKFKVTTSGSLTDFSVVHGLGYGCEDEVIRLVKEGPAWNPLLEDGVPVESETFVKLKFDPRKANR